MNTLNLNKSSFHYKIASFGFPDYRCTDIYSYCASIIRGIVLLMMFALIIAIYGSFAMNFVIGIIFSVIQGSWIMNLSGLIFMCIIMPSGLLYFNMED